MKPENLKPGGYGMQRRNLPHMQVGGGWYFITFSSLINPLSDKAKDLLARSIRFGHGKKYNLAIAVIMPDHAHLLFRPLQKDNNSYFLLQEIMQPLKSVAAHEINRLLERKGPVFNQESYDRVVRHEDEWHEKYGYIRNNAVKAGLVETPELWPWLLEEDGFLKRY